MKRTIPYRCPVCSGTGVVPYGFYNQTSGTWTGSGTGTEPCRSCAGTGIIYGEETNDVNYELQITPWGQSSSCSQ